MSLRTCTSKCGKPQLTWVRTRAFRFIPSSRGPCAGIDLSAKSMSLSPPCTAAPCPVRSIPAHLLVPNCRPNPFHSSQASVATLVSFSFSCLISTNPTSRSPPAHTTGLNELAGCRGGFCSHEICFWFMVCARLLRLIYKPIYIQLQYNSLCYDVESPMRPHFPTSAMS